VRGPAGSRRKYTTRRQARNGADLRGADQCGPTDRGPDHHPAENMRDASELATLLEQMDGRGYKGYKAITGAWEFPDFTLHVDHVQGDPFAAPTRVRLLLSTDVVALPESAYRTPSRALGTAAFLARAFAHTARGIRGSGSGKSGEIRMEDPGQTVLLQTAVLMGEQGDIEARFTVGLPAQGRRTLGRQASQLLTDRVPELARSTLCAAAHDVAEIEAHAAINEDAHALRGQLEGRDLVAFVADGSVLPRRSGIDDRPLEGESVVPFRSPDSLRVTLELPNAGPVSGMGVPHGVTLIVGGGFNGKSTLLRAIESGVYNHRPGDGREQVASRHDAVKVRAEDRRSVSGVDISNFIDGLPFGEDTKRFSTENASGSTSQAAAIVEALEAGARLLLVDEDTSATNFMIRDRRMQQLVPKEGEPITPFVDRIRELYESRGVNCVLVLGGSGDYLDVADTVIRMTDYAPWDVTAEARSVAMEIPTGRTAERKRPLAAFSVRRVQPRSVDARRGRRAWYVRVPDDRTLLFGEETIDLAGVEQIASRAQMRAIGQGLVLLAERVLAKGSAEVGSPAGGVVDVAGALDAVDSMLEEGGLDALDSRRVGDLAQFRRFELAAALNRLRTLKVD
jgi:predicted ABC-class ATPase